MWRGPILAAAGCGLLATQAEAAVPLDDPPIVGPMRICFPEGDFLLAQGERVTKPLSAFEGTAFTVEGRQGRYRISESVIFATPGLGAMVFDGNGARVYRVDAEKRSYAIMGVVRGQERVVAFLEGDALSGAARDEQIYKRIRLAPHAPERCQLTLEHTWRTLRRVAARFGGAGLCDRRRRVAGHARCATRAVCIRRRPRS